MHDDNSKLVKTNECPAINSATVAFINMNI